MEGNEKGDSVEVRQGGVRHNTRCRLHKHQQRWEQTETGILFQTDVMCLSYGQRNGKVTVGSPGINHSLPS